RIDSNNIRLWSRPPGLRGTPRPAPAEGGSYDVTRGTIIRMRSLILMLAVLSAAAAQTDWPAYGGGPEGIRYSPLKQINRSNVGRLQIAWTFDATDGPGASQTQPIVVDGVLFGI